MEYRRVSYNGLIADVREDHLQEAVEMLRSEGRSGRRRILTSVRKALDRATALGERMTLAQRQDACNDVSIWFAGEVLEGREDNHKVPLQ